MRNNESSILRILLPAALLAVSVVWNTHPAWADRVVMKNGRIVQGIILDAPEALESAELIHIRVGDTRIALPKAEIRSIEPDTPAQNALIEAQSDLEGGRVIEGMAKLRQALDGQAPADRIAALIAKQGTALAEVTPNLTPEDLEILRDAVTRAESSMGASWPDLNASIARLQMKLGDLDATLNAARWLPEDYRTTHPQWHQTMVEELQHAINAALETDHLRGQKLLLVMRQIDPVMESSRRTQFHLQIARQHRERKEFTQALEATIKFVLPDNPEIAQDRIKVTLDEAENHARSRDNLESVIELYKTYGMAHVEDTARERLGVLWHEQGWLYLRRDEFDEATKCFGQQTQYDSDGAQRNLKSVIYRRKLNALEDNDALGHYQLGIWCLENELLEPAEREFTLARRSPLIERNADTYINTIRIKLAERELMQLITMYEEGRYARVLEGLDGYLRRGYPSGYTGQAIQLQKLVRDAVRLQQAEKPQQAESLLQRAQRAYYQGDYLEADALLQAIFMHYRETVVYPRARNFHELVREKIMLGKLEQGKTLSEDQSSTTGVSATYRELNRLKRNLGNVSRP